MKKQNRVAFFNIMSTVVLQGISFFTAPLFMRLLGDSGYGVAQIYNTWVAVIAIVFTLQTQGTLVNATVAYETEERSRYHSAAMSMSLTLFALCTVLVLVFLNPIARLLKLNGFLVCMMLFQAFGTFCVNFLNIRNVYEFKAGHNMLLSVGLTITSLALSVFLILQLPQEVNYYGRIVAVAATYGLVGIPICISVLLRGKTFWNREYWKFCLVLAIPSVFYNLSDLILGQSDKVMLQQMLDEATVGQYAAALNFGGIMFVLFNALNNSWTPFFFEDKKQGDTAAIGQRARNFLELYTVLSVGFLLLSREVYAVFGGSGFRAGTDLIPVFVTSYFLNFLCTFPVNYEYYHRKTKVVAVVTICCSCINIGLNYVLIRAVGMPGAAIATAISHGLQLTAHYIYNRFLLGKGDYPFVLKMWLPYAAAYAIVVGLFYLAEPLWLLRWGLGAVIGLWELLRIRSRRVLI